MSEYPRVTFRQSDRHLMLIVIVYLIVRQEAKNNLLFLCGLSAIQIMLYLRQIRSIELIFWTAIINHLIYQFTVSKDTITTSIFSGIAGGF